MKLSELDGTVTFDCFFKVFWVDNRINVPDLWEAVVEFNPNILYSNRGTDLTQLVRNEDNPLRLWLPDLIFYNSNSVSVIEETIRMMPGGQMFWSRRLVLELQQPQFGM